MRDRNDRRATDRDSRTARARHHPRASELNEQRHFFDSARKLLRTRYDTSGGLQWSGAIPRFTIARSAMWLKLAYLILGVALRGWRHATYLSSLLWRWRVRIVRDPASLSCMLRHSRRQSPHAVSCMHCVTSRRPRVRWRSMCARVVASLLVSHFPSPSFEAKVTAPLADIGIAARPAAPRAPPHASARSAPFHPRPCRPPDGRGPVVSLRAVLRFGAVAPDLALGVRDRRAGRRDSLVAGVCLSRIASPPASWSLRC